MVKLQVRLHSGTATFLAGEQVNGEVIARVDSPTKARRIYVEVYGCAFNKWYGQDEYEYEAKVQFINVILLLWKPSGGSVGVIQPGNYCFPFSFVIPPNALPNHESKTTHGLVRVSLPSFRLALRLGLSSYRLLVQGVCGSTVAHQ